MRVAAPLLALSLSLAAPLNAATPGDPLEGFNRAMWSFNQGLDRIVLKPVTRGYRFVTPRPARRGLSRVFANLAEPWNAINALLQGKPKRALNSLGRFVVNTTIGVGGLADHATGFGLREAPEDFGQTLAVWGVKSSAYLVLPVFGPSTVRDGVGMVASQFGDPYRVCLRRCDLPNGLPTAANVLQVVDARSQLIDSGADAFLASSADSYATVRSAYLQRRAAAIADQDGVPPVTAPGSPDADLDAALKEIDAQDGAASGTPPAAPPAEPPLPEPRNDVPTPTSPQLVMAPLPE